MTDHSVLPDNLPVPGDDGRAEHLPNLRMPAITLSSSDGKIVDVSSLGEGRAIIYLYPLTGQPGTDLPDGWDAIPGARGCTPQSCGFRDHFHDLDAAGADHLYGLSTQDGEYQREAAQRLHLPFAILSDTELKLTRALKLPTFEAGAMTLMRRLTLVIDDGAIRHVFYPVFPPNESAAVTLRWLQDNPSR